MSASDNPYARIIPLTLKFSKHEMDLLKNIVEPTGQKLATFGRTVLLRHVENGVIDAPPEDRVMLAEAVATIIAALSDKYDEAESIKIAKSLFLTRRSL